MALLTKDQIADILENIAQMLELKGENVFKIRAYTNAARALETYSGDLATAAAENRLGDIPGIGKAIADKVTELIATGQLAYYETLKAEFPPGVFEMFELQGLGPKKIKALWDKLGVTTVAELEKACKDGRAAALSGFGKKTADNILAAIQSRAKHAGRFRLGEIAPDAERMLAQLRELPSVLQAAVAGSYRRRKEIVGDLDFIVATNAPAEVSDFFVKHEMVESVMANGATKSSVRLKNGIQADLRVVKNPEYPFALNYFTGSKEHNIVMRQRALARGWTLNEYRLGPDEKPKVEPQPVPPIREERDLYQALGLDYVEPELREDRGEFIAAENHTLPDLIETENLRGTFHNHTVASDGRSTLAEMAAAAQDLGLQYLGIADHSKASFQAHGLDAAQLLAQVAEIRELNKTFGGHFKIFAGSEVDILKDGSLDFPDEVLAQLDYCVVSIHNVFNLPEAEMTKRIIKAIENPYVTMLGHLTGRLLLSREGYAVDHAAVIEAAAATGTIIELNANPRRLDMDWRWWPLARAKGVKCAINPDAHHTGHLQFLHFGIGTARKGWLTRKDVVNTLPLGEIETALAKKTHRPRMKLISWNVNGIRAVLKKGFSDFIAQEKPDIVCLQETKATPEQVLIPEALAKYAAFWNIAEKKGYSGTAIFTKTKPVAVTFGMGVAEHDREGRVITAEYEDFFLVNVYVPNSKRELTRLPYRQEWDRDFLAYLKRLEKSKPVIWCGDLNVAHQEIDLARPKDNVKNHGFTPEERAGFDAVVAAGFVDSFRAFEKAGGHYTWWSVMSGARARNIGWRIDYFLCSAALRPRLKSAKIFPAITGSDHCPIGLELRKR